MYVFLKIFPIRRSHYEKAQYPIDFIQYESTE